MELCLDNECFDLCLNKCNDETNLVSATSNPTMQNEIAHKMSSEKTETKDEGSNCNHILTHSTWPCF